MNRKLVLVLTLTLLIGMLNVAFNVQKAKANGTIYIGTDGSVSPSSAPIRQDGDVYTLTANVTTEYGLDAIVIQRDNIIVDGANHSINATQYEGRAVLGAGVVLSGRSNVTIENMRITWFECGILLDNSSSKNYVLGNTMKDATDIQLRESYNNTISRNIIPEWDVGGISLSDSANNTVSENSMTSCGVHLAMSTGNFIYANNITKSSSALYLYSSNVNKICGNYIAENTQSAIELHNSSYNRISENEIRANYDGIRVEDMSENNSISGNIVTTSDRRDRSGPTDEGGYGIVIEGSSHNDISANSISANKGWGLGLFAEGNSVLRNDITHNGGGIWVIDASDNSLCQNNITANDVGICFWNSSNNSIFHNNFVNNAEEQVYGLYWTINIWDDGYPSGGNYWSDYNGADANRDGIGDTQYIIDENNTDHYPLMVPYVIPEFPSFLILPLFFIATLLAVMIYKWKYTPKVNRG